MKKIVLKSISMLLLILILTTLLAGCSGKEATPIKDAPYEIVWYTPDNPQADLEKVFEKVSEYTKTKINATVTCKIIDWGSYNSKMPILLGANEKMDIVYTSAASFSYFDYAIRGAFLQLDELLNVQGKDAKKVIPQDMFDSIKVNGKIYAVPTYKEYPVQWNAYISKEFSEKYKWNFSSIKNLYDIEPFLNDLKTGEKDFLPYPITSGYTGWDAVNPFDMITPMVGMKFEGADAKFVNVFASDEYKFHLEKMKEWKDKGYIRKDAGTRNNNNDYAALGKVGFSAFIYQPYGEALLTSKKAGTVFVSFPVKKAYLTNSNMAGSMIAIPRNSKNPQKTMEFINLLNTDATLKHLVVNGIEGQHYVKIDDKHIKYPEGKNYTNVGYSRAAFTLQNVFLNYLSETDPTDKYDKFIEFNAKGIKSNAFGFIPNKEPIETQLATCNSVINKYTKSLETASVDIGKYLPIFNEELKASGIQKIIDELQKQYDVWKQGK